MWLETHQECIGSSPRVLGACHDDAREFVRRRSRLAVRLSRVAEKLVRNNGPRSSLGIGQGLDDVVGSRWEFARRLVERIGKLAGNMKGDHREKTGGLIGRMPEATGLAEVGSKLSLWSLSVIIIESELKVSPN
ncbi:hypothetical protein B296_00005989 [Ensete ventricosum]|uniref:Uncharacterized protein n=1 Tax=Ensete ventricosum TaxID=4639 RepID=A0A426X084_ENSVE|nr:hypothetical protein B296_00005989 [Ensete ventricosum]